MFDIFSSHIFSRDSDLTSTNVSLSVRLSVTDQYVQGVPPKKLVFRMSALYGFSCLMWAFRGLFDILEMLF